MNTIDEDIMAPEEGHEVLNEEERQEIQSEIGRLRAAARKKYKTVCLECGKELIGLSRKRFCGQTHQRANWRRRLAAMGPGDVLPPPEDGVR